MGHPRPESYGDDGARLLWCGTDVRCIVRHRVVAEEVPDVVLFFRRRSKKTLAPGGLNGRDVATRRA